MKTPIGDIISAAHVPGLSKVKAINIIQRSETFSDCLVDNGKAVIGNPEEIVDYLRVEAINEVEEPSRAANDRKAYLENMYSEYEYYIEGVRGRTMWVFSDRVVINVDVTAGSILTGNITDGVKTIFFKDCIGVQFKEPGVIIGYLQVETASGLMNNNSSNFFNENTFTFEDHGQIEFVREVYEYICERVALYKKPPYSIPDEIRKYQELLKDKIITKEEFELKKDELLSL